MLFHDTVAWLKALALLENRLVSTKQPSVNLELFFFCDFYGFDPMVNHEHHQFTIWEKIFGSLYLGIEHANLSFEETKDAKKTKEPSSLVIPKH